MRKFFTFNASQVTWAAVAARAPYFGGTKNRGTAAQRAGKRYERRALERLQELEPVRFVASPWLVFRLDGEPLLRWCQPDGLLVDPEQGRITVVEIKLRHMAEAYTQINGIYLPVLRRIFPHFQFRQVEVVRWYDPYTPFPVPVQMVSALDLVPATRFAVHILKP